MTMAQSVHVPKWGLTIESVVILAWLKAEGDAVAEDEDLCEVETDKAEATIYSPCAGRLERILAVVGQECEVGSVIALIEPS